MKVHVIRKSNICISILVLFFSVMIASCIMSAISFNAEDNGILIKAELEKYINYSLTEEKKESLVQYGLNVKMEKETEAIKDSEINVQLQQIDNQYPKQVKVLTKRGEIETSYDMTTGDLILKQAIKQDESNYHIICYYDTYTEETLERDVTLKVEATAVIGEKDDITIEAEETFENKVTEEVGKLISINYQTEEIYNGGIKSNKINKTQYNTPYHEKEDIIISQKDFLENIEMVEKSTFAKSQISPIYKATKIDKESLVKVLGEDGKLELFDKEGNIIATLDKDNNEINYEQELETIIVRTSSIQAEGILSLEHTKEIKATMIDLEEIEIKTINQIVGQEGMIENVVGIKEAQTKVSLNHTNSKWTNEQQNEVTFNISLSAKDKNENLFKNPSVKIELPNQVEKVILQNSGIFYGNGLELQNTYVETGTNGKLAIVADLVGTQTEYQENFLDLTTDIKIQATVILKKDIQTAQENIKLFYTNQYTADESIETGEREYLIQLESYQEELAAEIEDSYEMAKVFNANTEGLKVEVMPVKGDSTIADGDVLYEGEYIKYNVKVTNTSNQPIEQIKIVGNVPDGTTYAELEADYYNFCGEYKYNLQEEVKNIPIEIGTLKPGESKIGFYEVQVKDLEETVEQKQITTNMEAKVGEIPAGNYKIENTVKKAKYKIFLKSYLYTKRDEWYYFINVTSKEEEAVEVSVKLPKQLIPQYFYGGREVIEEYDENNAPKDNVFTVKISTNQPDFYYIRGEIPPSNIIEKTEDSKIELTAVASIIESENITYQSNENRILYEYENLAITMTSPNEGEEVKEGEEIDYHITITNIGRTNLNYKEYCFNKIKLKDILPQEVKPISVTYDNWEMEVTPTYADGPDETILEGSLYTGNYKKTEAVLEDLGNRKNDEQGNPLPDVELEFNIPYKESVTILVKAQAKPLLEKTKIENSAKATGKNIEEKTSNIITHTILPIDHEIEEKPDQPDQPDNPSKPINPEDPEETYSISGVAWMDKNEDGQRQEGEQLLSDIPVLLVNMKEATVVKENIRTGANGSYRFTDLKQGNYLVLFQYDQNRYHITQYQKNGISQSSNSDAVDKQLKINGKTQTVGMIEVNNLQASRFNMDIGLIENRVCDLKLDKSISRITVKTNRGTKQYTYHNEKLAKIEIKAKEIEGAVVLIEYKMTITNQGEIATTVGKVKDILPKELVFVEENNPNWKQQANGEIINTNLSDRKLEPGENVELTLIAQKTMTADATGTISNTAEIEEIKNTLKIQDKDETNNSAKAEIIISVSTGIMIYLSISMALVGMVGIVILVAHKYNIKSKKKMFIFGLCIMFLVASTYQTSIACTNQAHLNLKRDQGYAVEKHIVNAGPQIFTINTPEDGDCQDHGFQAHGYGVNPSDRCEKGYGDKYRWYYTAAPDATDIVSTGTTEPANINLRIHERTFITKVVNSHTILGPFFFSKEYNDVVNYSYQVKNWNNQEITTARTCDINGNSKDLRGDSATNEFYLRIPMQDCEKGIASVTVKAHYTGERVESSRLVGKIMYFSDDSTCQDVRTIANNFPIKDLDDTKTPVIVKDEITWAPRGGFPINIEIIKQDADNQEQKLAGVQIRVQCPAIGYNQVHTTDQNGKIVIENFPANVDHIITEIATPHYGYFPEATQTVKARGGTYLTVKLNNIKHTGNMQIMKKDKDSGRYLSGVGFKVKNDKNEYIIAVDQQGSEQKKVTGEILLGNLHYTQNEEEATEFFTNEEGLIGIYNIITGTYQAIETTIGENNQGYEIDDDYISWETEEGKEIGQGKVATITVQRQPSYYTEQDKETASKHTNILTVNNKRKYVRLSGNVWEDIPWEEKSGLKSNEHLLNKDEYPKDTNDKLLQHVTVKLKDKNENIVAFKDDKGNTYEEIETDEKGHYVMWDVLIDKLEEYYIEFTYNGMKYESVAASINKEKVGNKAIEKQNRIDYNNQYTTIVKDGRKDEKGKATYDLKYDTTNYTSTIHYGDTLKYGYQGQKYPINGTYENFLIRANTRNAYEGYLNLIQTKESIRENAVEEIENINLGVKERLEPDLSLVKDIHNVKVSINKANHLYNYADRYNKRLYGENGTEGEDPFYMEPRVRYESKYGNMSYTRALYPSDVYYNGEDGLRVKVTYKIGIKNKTTIRSIVNEVNDYYDSKFYQDTNIVIGTQLDEQGNIVETSKLNFEVEKQSGYDLYYKLHIKDINMDLRQTAKGYIYVELEVKQDKIIEIIEANQAGKDVKLDNIAEIASYSLKDEKGNAYAGIDKNSQPGSVDVNNPKTFEDDTDRAPGLKIILQENRKLDGVVFEDEVLTTDGFKVNEVNSGKIRQGNGIYDQNEKGIGKVEVRLVTVKPDGTEEIAQIWNTLARKWEAAITQTKEDGSYYFEGFLPENYKVLYIWGDQTYRVQDYKATIYKDDQHQGNEWYKQIQTRYSDAKDNYQTRKEIDDQARLVTNANQKVIEAYAENGQIELKDNGGKQTLKTKMDSRTDLFIVNLEYKKEATYGPDEHTNYLKNIDFGIVERAKQTLKLSKEVERVKLVLSNGNVLVDAKIGENGEIDDKVKYTTYIPKSGAANGQIKLEVDNEILQSARLEVTYRFKVENISELDYLNKDYYTYGKGKGEIDKDLVALDASTVIDYLDNNLAKDLGDNEWIAYSIQDKKDLIDTYGLLGEELRQTLTQTNTVAHTDILSQDLQPKGISEKEGTLKVYRMLPSVLQEEDSTMGNDAEIIKIVKSGGASVTTIPGNYVPSEGIKEVDEASSETVTIVPPTGGGINVIAYTLLAISSLGILVSGIILIKKLVLK